MTAKYVPGLDSAGNRQVSVSLEFNNIHINNLARKAAFDTIMGGIIHMKLPSNISEPQWQLAVNLQLIGLKHLNVAINN